MEAQADIRLATEGYLMHPGWESAAPRRVLVNTFSRVWMALALLSSDMLSLSLGAVIALQFRELRPEVSLYTAYERLFLVLGITLVILFYRKHLYPAVGLHYVDELRDIITSCAVAFLVTISVTFVFKNTVVFSRVVLVLTTLLCMLLIPAGRYFTRKLLVHWKMWGEPVLIIGEAHERQKTDQLIEYFTGNPQFGLLPVSVMNSLSTRVEERTGCPALNICRAKKIAQRLSLRTVLLVTSDLSRVNTLVNIYRHIFPRVILVRDQTDGYGLNNMRGLDFRDVLGFQVKNNLLDYSAQLSKRLVDIAASLSALLVLAPLLSLIALLIKLDTGGRIFYRQLRLGRDGKPFTLVKFRTMHMGADQVLKEALRRDAELQKEWDSFQKLKNDPRITRVGKLLRRFSLDELPQLWNILIGQMSLVGPRPIMLDQRKMYGEPIREYIQVRPGITGLWQVSGRNETTFARRAALDLEYIQRWSHWLDLFILLKTIKVVLWRNGAY